MLTIIQAESEAQIAQAQFILREYEEWLGLDLCFQGFEAEMASLPGKYAKPDGRLYLAFFGEKLAGCIAMRKLENGVGEMKRLFVRTEFRGQRIGVHLIEKVIADARDIGYKALRLDTHPQKMGKAVRLYEYHGFRQIAPYYENPHDDVLFMELAL